MTTLVIGAREGSLGEAIRKVLSSYGEKVVTAGIAGENLFLKGDNPDDIHEAYLSVLPDKVVVTIGTNIPATLRDDDLWTYMEQSFYVNTVMPMLALHEYVRLLDESTSGGEQFVAISSNSAHIARRGSIPYCSTKAALSMALRCAARELAGSPCLVYGYEFGLLAGTPMTQQTNSAFVGPPSRMPGAENGLSVYEAAQAVVGNLMHPWHGLNGTMLRLDAGEQ